MMHKLLCGQYTKIPSKVPAGLPIQSLKHIRPIFRDYNSRFLDLPHLVRSRQKVQKKKPSTNYIQVYEIQKSKSNIA